MALQAEVQVRVFVQDENGVVLNRELPALRFTPGANLPKREVVSLTGSAFTALSPPSGAQLAIVELGAATSLTWKGITGDTGTTICPASNPPGGDMVIWLGATPSLGIANAGSTVSVVVIWL